MSQPTIGELHIDQPLTNLAVAYRQEGGYLADIVFPPVPVQKRSDKYFVFDRDVFRTARGEFRAPGTAAAVSGYSVGNDNYSCERYSLRHPIPDPIRANTDAPLNLDEQGMQFVMDSLMLKLEVAWAATFFTTSVWTGSSTATDITVSTAWSDVTSTPIEDIQTQLRALEANTGKSDYVLAVGRKVYDNLNRHPDIIDLIKGAAGPGNPAVAGPDTLARVLGVQRVVVARAARNSSAEGKAASYAVIENTRSALLVHAAAAPGIMIPSGGYQFVWGGSGNNMGITFKRFREEPIESDWIEGNVWFDFKVTGAYLGAYFTNCVAA